MEITTRPLFALYVMWHPSYREAGRLRIGFAGTSKHDDSGESVARGIRDRIHAHSPLESFFDIHDIPAGLPFGEVLLHPVGAGAVVAVHTDSYSSREWCRREVIKAKRRLVPMIVVDCLRDVDPRGMACLGNVPVVRMEPGRTDRIATIASCLLDEIFRAWLWLHRVGTYLPDSPGALFAARPPELIALRRCPPEAKIRLRRSYIPNRFRVPTKSGCSGRSRRGYECRP